MQKIKIPKNQISWLSYKNEDGDLKYIVTSDIQRSKYFLYKIDKDYKLIKLHTKTQPLFKEVGDYNE